MKALETHHALADLCAAFGVSRSGYHAWKAVYHIFRRWTLNHQWAALNDALRTLVRRAEDKRRRPTAAILDSQSVKSANHCGEVGYDAAKRIKGRKRHLLVDTLGLVLGVAVTAASVTERAGAQVLLGSVLTWFTWLRILWVDGGDTQVPASPPESKNSARNWRSRS